MPRSMETAPRDGTAVTVQWRDREGVENVSLARYRSGDPSEAGWWVFVDSDTQKRVEPHGWIPAGADDGES